MSDSVKSKVFDPVRNPKHYTDCNIECIDAVNQPTTEVVGLRKRFFGAVEVCLWRRPG